jgi:hypothetical protein
MLYALCCTNTYETNTRPLYIYKINPPHLPAYLSTYIHTGPKNNSMSLTPIKPTSSIYNLSFKPTPLTYLSTYIHTHTHTHTHTYIYTHTHIHTHTYTHRSQEQQAHEVRGALPAVRQQGTTVERASHGKYVCMYVCMYVCDCLSICDRGGAGCGACRPR